MSFTLEKGERIFKNCELAFYAIIFGQRSFLSIVKLVF